MAAAMSFAPMRAEGGLHDGGGDAVLRGVLDASGGDGGGVGGAGQRQDAEVDEVAGDVEEQDYAGAEGEAERKIALGVFDFACGEGDVVPGVGAEERADLHDGEDGEEADVGGGTADAGLDGVEGVRCSVRPRSLSSRCRSFAAMAAAFLATRPDGDDGERVRGPLRW